MKKNYFRLLSLGAALTLSAATAAAEPFKFVGSVIFPENAAGIWEFNADSYAPRQLAQQIYGNAGGFAVGDIYYVNRMEEIMGIEAFATISYKIGSWEVYDNYTATVDKMATTMAYDPIRDEVYGCFVNAERNGYEFASWNYDYYRRNNTICTLPRKWNGCAFDSKGTLYAIECNGDLYTVDIKTGQQTLVGSTGITSDYYSDCIIDPETDTMYWVVNSQTQQALYKVSLANAAATKLYELANMEQICSMYVPRAEIPAGAPAKVYSISTSFSGTAMTGRVSFSMPSATVAGDKITDSFTYTVRANGVVVAQGEAAPGTRVNADVTLDTPDSYNFTVVTTNDAGTSDIQKAKKYVGPDTPKAPGSLAATWADGVTTLQWGSVSSSGVNNGSVNYSAATYTVVRYPDMKTVVADQPATQRTATDQLPVPADKRVEYWYEVTATAEGLTSAPKASAKITLGPVDPAWTEPFATSAAMAGWALINANADSYKWTYNSSGYVELSGSYNASSGLVHDDWLVTPPLRLEAGKTYPVSIDAKCYNKNYPEKFEIFAGTAAAPEALTVSVLPETTVAETAFATFSGEFTPETDGLYHIGIHATSPAPCYRLTVDNFTVAEGVATKSPAAPADFTVDAPTDGTVQATITLTLPLTDIGGATLAADALTRVEITRDGTVIYSADTDLTPGAAVTCTDNAQAGLTPGTHTYEAAAYNRFGIGNKATLEKFIGAARPVAPAAATMVETDANGKVRISWDPVTTDIHGNTLIPEAVTYRLMNRSMQTIADGITATEIEVQAVDPGQQAFVQFGVYAVTAGGESEKYAATDYKPVGKALETPWAESFTDKTIKNQWGYNYIKGNDPWYFVDEANGIRPADADNGFAYFECYGTYTALVTPKIDLAGLFNPVLTYYLYNYLGGSGTENTNELAVEIDNGDGTGFRPLHACTYAQTGPANTWNKVTVDLAEFDGQAVVLRFVPRNAYYAYYTLDKVAIASHFNYNLAAEKLELPAVVDPDKEFEIAFTYTNPGENEINKYLVELWSDDRLVESIEGQRIAPDARHTVIFTQKLTVKDAPIARYYAAVNYSADEYDADNATEPATVGIAAPVVPAVTDLAGTPLAEGVTLAWTAPDLTAAAPAPHTEGFEAASAWSETVEGWKFVDADSAPFGGMSTTGFPFNGRTFAWGVVERSWFDSNGVTSEAYLWDAHAGSKYILSAYPMRGGQMVQADDWAITPRLIGDAQAVSFYAKSFAAEYLETFEVLYSETTTDPAAFTTLATVLVVPNAWTQYRYMLPEGAKYFAIRSRSYDKYLLFVDDVTFIPADGEPQQLEILGYNIYRDGEKINSQPIAATTYTDAESTAGKPAYFVTAVYDKGESRPSNKITVDFSGIDQISADAPVTILGRTGCIDVIAPEGTIVTVAALDGRVIARRTIAGTRITIPAATGIYAVTAARHTAKVFVR